MNIKRRLRPLLQNLFCQKHFLQVSSRESTCKYWGLFGKDTVWDDQVHLCEHHFALVKNVGKLINYFGDLDFRFRFSFSDSKKYFIALI